MVFKGKMGRESIKMGGKWKLGRKSIKIGGKWKLGGKCKKLGGKWKSAELLIIFSVGCLFIREFFIFLILFIREFKELYDAATVRRGDPYRCARGLRMTGKFVNEFALPLLFGGLGVWSASGFFSDFLLEF